VINAIKERLRKLGWEPLKDDFLNPGLASSHSVGWQEFEDATITPPKHVHQWLAQWVNRDGDVTWYAFRYEYLRDGDPDLHTLTVMASYFPKDVAGMLKSTQHTAEPGHALDAHKDARE
jgi:hypothetical protein